MADNEQADSEQPAERVLRTIPVYQLDARCIYVGETVADESPLDEPGVFLIPADCVEVAPPEIPDGKCARFDHGTQQWEIVERFQAPPPPAPDIAAARRAAYQNEADPLYMQWQRGEATREQWLEKVTEIRNRFPKD